MEDDRLEQLRAAAGPRVREQPNPDAGFGKVVGDGVREGMRLAQPSEERFCLTCNAVTTHYQIPNLNPERADGKWPQTYEPPLRRPDGTEVHQTFVRSSVTWCEGHSGKRPLRIEQPVLPLSEAVMERAAIIEHCGGVDRIRAERLALEQAGAFDFRRGSSPRGPTSQAGGAPA